jgi:hypothetical protein
MTDEYARLTPAFWGLLLATAVAAGLLGSALMLLLTTVEHLAFGYDSGTLEDAAEHASAARRVPVVGRRGGVRRRGLVPAAPVRARADRCGRGRLAGDGELGFRRSVGTSVVSIIVVGMGVSLGREAARSSSRRSRARWSRPPSAGRSWAARPPTRACRTTPSCPPSWCGPRWPDR